MLNDLYRLGFLGNFLPASKVYRWQHKGDSTLILSDEWRLFVHYALHGALSLGSRFDYGLNRGEEPQVGDVAIATVVRMTSNYVICRFTHYGHSYDGRIRKHDFLKLGYNSTRQISRSISPNDEFPVVVKTYVQEYNCWNLKINPPIPSD